ncbi:MAG: OsmC family protein [Endomicrobiales bacterium]
MYHVAVTSTEGTEFRVRSADSEFVIDTGTKGNSPVDHLLASLGACVGYYLRIYNSKHDLGIREFEVRVEGELARERPARFKEIRVQVDLKGVHLDEEKSRSLAGFIRSCPVHSTLSQSPEIQIGLS